MTAARKTQARKPATKKPTAGAISVADLPDNQTAQVNEAMKEPARFVMGNGAEFTFKAPVHWSYKADIAFARGDIVGWAHGALEDPDKLDAFLDASATEVGRIIRYFDDRAGVTRGEGSSSSTS